MKKGIQWFAILTLISTVAYAELQENWDFDKLKAGKLPNNWELAETNGKGKMAVWEVTDDEDENKVLSITNNSNSNKTASLAMIKIGAVKHIELGARIKAGSPGDSAGGGLIWRVIDVNHYYLARWDPIGKTCRLYLTIGGEASLLESVRLDADTDEWHQFDVVHNEGIIEIVFDGDPVLEFEDNQLDLPGWVGLWAPGDALPSFDDVTVYTEDDIK